jgi:hypothetical protein
MKYTYYFLHIARIAYSNNFAYCFRNESTSEERAKAGPADQTKPYGHEIRLQDSYQRGTGRIQTEEKGTAAYQNLKTVLVSQYNLSAFIVVLFLSARCY